MSDKKYALHPGSVYSRNDGEIHRVASGQLAQLYRVPLRECVVIDINSPDYDSKMKQHKDLFHLYPDESGKYQLPFEARHER